MPGSTLMSLAAAGRRLYVPAPRKVRGAFRSRALQSMKKSLVLAASIPLLLASAAAGQTIDSPYRFVDQSQLLGATAGYIFTNRGSAGFGPASAPYAGLRYAIRINGPFVLEGTAAYFPTTRNVLDSTQVNGAYTVLDQASMSLLLLKGVLRFDLTGPRTWYNTIPHLLVGGGGVIQTSNEEPQEQLNADLRFRFGTSFAGQLGAGIEWLPTRRLGLKADSRMFLWKLTAPTGFLTEEATIPQEEWVQNYVLSGGIVIRF